MQTSSKNVVQATNLMDYSPMEAAGAVNGWTSETSSMQPGSMDASGTSLTEQPTAVNQFEPRIGASATKQMTGEQQTSFSAEQSLPAIEITNDHAAAPDNLGPNAGGDLMMGGVALQSLSKFGGGKFLTPAGVALTVIGMARQDFFGSPVTKGDLQMLGGSTLAAVGSLVSKFEKLPGPLGKVGIAGGIAGALLGMHGATVRVGELAKHYSWQNGSETKPTSDSQRPPTQTDTTYSPAQDFQMPDWVNSDEK